MQPFGLLSDNGYPSDDPRFALNYTGGGASGNTPTNADVLGRVAYGLTNFGGMQDAAGLLGGPSLRENVSGGNYLDAALQGVGVLPIVGGVAKGLLGGAHLAAAIPAARSIAKAAKPAEAITEAVPQGIVAYHGSPHSFDAFDTSKAGSGTGAQAQGAGAYLSAHEPVALHYRDGLKYKTDDVVSANKEMSNLAKIMDKYEIPGKYREFRDPAGYEAAKRYDELMAQRANAKGHMYEVKFNADPNHLLDWNKPLNEQTPHVQEVLKNLGINQNLSGEDIYASLRYGPPKEVVDGTAVWDGMTMIDAPIDSKQIASKKLLEAGVPGITYRDKRFIENGNAAQNYVAFDDKMLEIMRKYGLVGLLGGGMAMNASQQQSQPGL
jgi:hypothetical protein